MTLYLPSGGERCVGLKAPALGKYDADLNELHIGVEHDDTLGNHRFPSLWTEAEMKTW